MRSISRHVDDNRIIDNKIIVFIEKQINSSDFTRWIISTLIFFNVDFNDENKFLSLAYGCRNDVAVFNKFDANAVSILIFRKHAYAHFNVSL